MQIEINPNLLTVMLLYSLPPSFENFRCAIESRDDLPSLETLRIKIVEESDAWKSDARTTAPLIALIAKRPCDNKQKPRPKQTRAKWKTANFAPGVPRRSISRVDAVQRQCAKTIVAAPSLSMKLEFDNLEALFRRRSNNFASEIDAPLGQPRILGSNFRRCF